MAFFRNCDPDDPLCMDECRLQKFEYLRWVRLLPSVECSRFLGPGDLSVVH
ncbi:hypothetical protein CIP107534_01726 [Corynebacterium diphtheriae]|nr:hypothetical protein CIP107534_01726 [Corynebacterium diphtheriae]